MVLAKLSAKSTAYGPIYYKDWSANSIHLRNKAGKTFKIFFITSDCTYTDHFCYAYIDIDKNCTNAYNGNVFCPTDLQVNLKAPNGYQNYRWFNSNFTQLLGTNQTLTVMPPPANGTVFSVEVTPKDGFGCKDTLTAAVYDTLRVVANAGVDVASCNGALVMIGTAPISGMRYRWSPATNISNPNIANPMVFPSTPTLYTLTVTSEGQGCAVSDMVNVNAIAINTNLTLTGKDNYCLGVGALPILRVSPNDNIQWYKDSIAINGAILPSFQVTQRGNYYAVISNNQCPSAYSTVVKRINIDTAIIGITYPPRSIAFNFPEKLVARNLGKSVLWTPAINLSNTKSYTPIFKGFNQQLYKIEITNNNGCITTDTLFVNTFKKIAIYVPTIFSPNGDGLNDYLKPVLAGFVKVNYFRIFDRWGKMIFETKKDTPGWDGTINGIVQETQSIVWMLEAIDIDGQVHQKTGTTVLFR
jgi:gliding motility-associated-like protein